MDALLKKLNYQEGMRCYLHTTDDLDLGLFEIPTGSLLLEINGAKVDFALLAIKETGELDIILSQLMPALSPSTVLWFVYIKKSSKKFSGGITRDAGWEPLGAYGYEAVRQVSINEDWSALRFKPVTEIKSLKRDSKRRLS